MEILFEPESSEQNQSKLYILKLRDSLGLKKLIIAFIAIYTCFILIVYNYLTTNKALFLINELQKEKSNIGALIFKEKIIDKYGSILMDSNYTKIPYDQFTSRFVETKGLTRPYIEKFSMGNSVRYDVSWLKNEEIHRQIEEILDLFQQAKNVCFAGIIDRNGFVACMSKRYRQSITGDLKNDIRFSQHQKMIPQIVEYFEKMTGKPLSYKEENTSAYMHIVYTHIAIGERLWGYFCIGSTLVEAKTFYQTTLGGTIAIVFLIASFILVLTKGK
ncbi:MAG: hypothetical protein HQK79_20165 [Desulfobacterales bacterium]|nr:hypothetical protein [Desulfobacterales bacterium]